MSLSYSQIEEILKAGDFSKLKDEFENEFLDVKTKAYDFRDVKEKIELCKDVSSFANYKGGFIVLGVSARKLEDKPHEKIDSVSGITVSDINKQTYIQHLENGVFPKITGLCTFEFSKLDGKNIFYIKISQELNDRPYLVRKDKYVGYWLRTETHNLQERVDRLHEISRNGLHYQESILEIGKKVDELLELARNGTSIPPAGVSEIDELLSGL